MSKTEISELSVIAQENGLEPTKVENLLSKFGSSYAEAKELTIGANKLVVTQEDQTSLMKEARTKRLALKNVRVEVENTRKTLKEQSLREGKAIDGMSNIIKALIIPVEEHLEKQEKFAEVKQAERKATRHAERVEKLSKYVDDVSLYSLQDMTDETFDNLVASSKTAAEAQAAALAKVEADRIEAEKEAAKEQERIRLENVKLKEEAAKHDAEMEAERKKREAIELAETKRREEEAAKVAANEEKAHKLQLAPDKDKLVTLADTLDSLELPTVVSDEATSILGEAKDFLARISKNLRAKADEL